MKEIKMSNPFEGSFGRLTGQMVVQIVQEKSEYIVRCQITRHPKSSEILSKHNDLDDATDAYIKLLRLASA